MKKILTLMIVLCLDVFCIANNICCMSFPEQLESALQNQSGFKVINVTRRKSGVVRNGRINYLPQQILSKDAVSKILEKISEKINGVTEPTFIVFNEYFFSNSTLEYIDYQSIINQIIEFSSKNPLVIIYANFLYKMNERLSEEIISFIDKYRQAIEIHTSTWEVTKTSHAASAITYPQTIFTNETSVFYNNVIISKYRKSTYYEEDDVLLKNGGWYYYGSGRDIVCEALGNDHIQIANIINKYVYTDIC